MVWLLVLRNIIRNKRNSFIILFLIFVITLLFFTGNSIIGQSEQGLRASFPDSLTGEAVIQKAGDVTMNLFGANTPVIDEYFTIPPLPAYDTIMDLVSHFPGIAGITSQVSSRAYLDVLGLREPVLLCGADPETYFAAFPGIILEEGRFLEAGKYGAMITRDRAERIERETGRRLAMGTPLLFTAGGEAGFKIREVPLTGIYSYRSPGLFMNEIVIADPQTVRALASIQVASSGVNPSGEAVSLFGSNLDDLFDNAFSTGTETGSSVEAGRFSADVLSSFLQDLPEGEEGKTASGGDWNFIILRLKKGTVPSVVINALNKKLSFYGVTAVGWRTAAGNSAILLLLVQALFNAGIFLISAAGVIAVVNILLISVFRRTREIGTLRAMGADDGSIRFLILGENCILAAVGGALGVAVGAVLFKLTNILDISIPNSLIASLLGGPALYIPFIPAAALASFGLALILGFTASLYPVETAVRIEPVVAVRQG
jgi:ABC-type lipoprotein release transport system permease subunit